jgi:branched-chain amino acid transport system substrate-binding protein
VALLKAVEKADSTDYDALTKALHSEYVDTPVGKISFDKNGDATGIGFTVYKVEQGKYIGM